LGGGSSEGGGKAEYVPFLGIQGLKA
jgi:hypothetical protein